MIQVREFWRGCETLEGMQNEIKLLIKEYLQTKDTSEILLSVQQKKISPSFMHELVKKSFTLAIDMKDYNQEVLVQLYKELMKSQVLSHEQLLVGFRRIQDQLQDIALDAPNAAS